MNLIVQAISNMNLVLYIFTCGIKNSNRDEKQVNFLGDLRTFKKSLNNIEHIHENKKIFTKNQDRNGPHEIAYHMKEKNKSEKIFSVY